jgi:hypothetical protein
MHWLQLFLPPQKFTGQYCKGKGLPTTCQCRYRGGAGLQLHSFLTQALDQGERSAPRPGQFILRNELRYPLHRRLAGPQARFGRVWRGQNLLPLQSSYSAPFSVASRYTDYTLPVHLLMLSHHNHHNRYFRRVLENLLRADFLNMAFFGHHSKIFYCRYFVIY